MARDTLRPMFSSSFIICVIFQFVKYQLFRYPFTPPWSTNDATISALRSKDITLVTFLISYFIRVLHYFYIQLRLMVFF